MAGEAGRGVANGFQFTDDRIFRAILDDAALMLGDGAKAAAAKAAAHDCHRMLDHLEGGDLPVAVFAMRLAGIRQIVNRVHLLGRQWNRRGIDPHVSFTVALDQGAGIAGVGFLMQHARGMGIQHGIVQYLLIGRQANHRAGGVGSAALKPDHVLVGGGRGAFLRIRLHLVGVYRRTDGARAIDFGRIDRMPIIRWALAQQRGAANIGQGADRLTRRQPMGDFHHLALAIAVNQQVSLGIHQDRPAHLVRPVIVVRDTPQAGLDTAQHDGHLFISFPAALGVDGHATVRPLMGFAARCVGIV